MTLRERSKQRRARIVVHRAKNFDEAEAWDLEFWQQKSPAERLSALVALHRDVEMATRARDKETERQTGGS